MNRFIGSVLAAGLLVLSACGSDAASSSKESTVPNDVTVSGSGSVTLAVGQQLVVTLDSNPSTGYDWQVVGEPDAAVLSIGERVYVPTPVDPGVVGSGGVTASRFTAVAAGTTSIVLRYKRSWEDDTPADELVTVEVTVTG
jgi:inhibitor of cysteine peptidase